MKKLSQWRTVAVIVLLCVVLLVALLVCSRAPEAFGLQAFETLCWTAVGFATIAAGKSSVEHLAGGGGVKGAIAALLTESKPEAPPA